MLMKYSDRLFFFIQAILKYNAFNFGIRLRYVFYKPFFKYLGKNVKIKDGVTFKYPSEITINDGCVIGEFCYFVGKGGLKIGKYVMIASGSKIITSTHISRDKDIPMYLQESLYEPIELKDDIWIGFDVKIFSNTIIGNGVIVGTNSMVKNIELEDYKIYAGTPVKLIRERD